MAENESPPAMLSPQKRLNDSLCTNNSRENLEQDNHEDFLCPICLYLLIEPVVLPCEHEFCKTCFTQNVQEANLQCPLCRVRISSWARKHARNGSLVHKDRWKLIKKLFPKRCEKRLRGEEEDEDDHPVLKRVLSENGAIRSEYEQEIRKIRQIQEEEQQASEKLIRRLMLENDSVAQEREEQKIRDEEIAKQLQNENQKEPRQAVALNRPNNNGKLKQSSKTKNDKCTAMSTLDKWFSPKSKVETNSGQKRLIETSYEGGANGNDKLSNDSQNSHDNTGARSELFADIDPSYAAIIKRRKEQEEEDFKFALQLQKELQSQIKAQKKVERKKGTVDGYLLRNCEASTSTSSESDEVIEL